MVTTVPVPRRAAADVGRVAIVIDADVYGGAEAYIGALLRSLPPAAAALVATEPVPQPLVELVADTGLRLHRLPKVRSKRDVAGAVAVVRALRSLRADVIHVNMATATNNRYALAAAIAVRVPTVVTVHSLAEVRSPGQRRLLRRLLSRVAAATAPSHAIAAQLRDLGAPAAAVRVVAAGVEARPSRSWDGDRATVRVGVLGRLSREKGVDVLVEAVRLLGTEGPVVEVAVAGDGPERAALERQAAGLPIRFVGFVDPSSFLDEIDLFCLPSRLEGMPVALLEAMMAGLPCVATAVGDVGLLEPAVVTVAPEDPAALCRALAALAADPAERRRLGEAARALVLDRYEVSRMVEEVLGLYAAAVADRRR